MVNIQLYRFMHWRTESIVLKETFDLERRCLAVIRTKHEAEVNGQLRA
jgi:hypothetical protein